MSKPTPKAKEIVLPKLTSYQQVVWDWLGTNNHSGKVAVIKSVRQSGKSFFALLKLIEYGFTFQNTVSAIFEPTLSQSRNMYNLFKKFLDGSNLIKNANAQTLEITLLNGSQILFKSTEQDPRSFTISGLLVLDEAAYLIDEQIYTILPLLQANNTPLIVISTPFIREGYFYDMYLLGLEENKYNTRTFDWAEEKEIERFLTPERKDFYKQTMSPSKYRTEVLGLFLSEEGLLFNGLDACINDTPKQPTVAYIGIDFASGGGGENDYTVLSVVNQDGQQTEIHRTNHLTPTDQIEWLAAIINDISQRATIKTILAEKNSIGAVYIDALNKRLTQPNLTITDWVTTNSSKQDLVTTLQIALENGYISILNNEVMLNELRRYAAEINPTTRVIKYNGKGAHDDTVIALMLSYKAYKSSLGKYTINFNTPNRSSKTLAEKYS